MEDAKLNFVVFLPLLILLVLLVSQNLAIAEAFYHHLERNSFTTSTSEVTVNEGKCNILQGAWVFDNTSYALYNSSSCPFIDPEFKCTGRPDKLYQNYRWQPSQCNLTRLDGLQFLREWKGKKIMFVGDSLSLNQFDSLACMIHSSVPNSNTSYIVEDVLRTLTFQEFDVTLYSYRSNYLVDLMNETAGRILKLDSINGTAWLGMDMLIFNSWHWWSTRGQAQPWDFIQEGDKLYKDMDRVTAFSKGLATWARWVNLNVNITKTRVFFVGISPTHYLGTDWNEPPTKTCLGMTKPFNGTAYPGGLPQAWGVVEKVIEIEKPVYWLDITTLSQYRIDAHPSIYSPLGTDCSHWCLPGLPDTWNDLLHAALFL